MSSKPIGAAQARAIRLLDAWIALESLTPQSFRGPKELLTQSRSGLIPIRNGKLDWTADLKGAGDRRIYHHVLLGEVQLGPSYDALGKRFVREEQEVSPAAHATPLGVVLCNERGVPQVDSLALSSFAWALPIALTGELQKLKTFAEEERRILTELKERLAISGEDGERLPLTHDVLLDAHGWLVKELGLQGTFIKPPSFFLREHVFRWIREPPETLLLNSFFLRELTRVRSLVMAGKAPLALLRYLGAASPESSRDVLRDGALFSQLLSPALTPRGRWPGLGHRPLVALQQAAVNAAMSSRKGDVVAVNGPPGTGKTTLLKDIVAAVVSARAEVLAGFDEPSEAFTRTGIKISRAQAKVELRSIAPELRGFEIVAASSNNKAVENVSAELPVWTSIADDVPELRYFSSIATALRGEPSWGLVAAVLGNAGNLRSFFETFWDDEDRGLETYLATAAGTPRMYSAVGSKSRVPQSVQEENPPASPAEGLARWKLARKEFAAVLAKTREGIRPLERIDELEAGLRRAHARVETVELTLRETAPPRLEEPLAEGLSPAQCETELGAHLGARPKRGSGDLVAWKEQEKLLRARLVRARTEAREAQERQDARRRDDERAVAEIAALRESRVKEETFIRETDAELERLSRNVLTAEKLWARPHAERQQGTPWFDEGQQRLRDDLFIAALKLHKAFIDAAAEPIRHNLAAFRAHLRRPITDAEEEETRDLFATFSLVVPLLSTTFASVEKMFRKLGPASLGWLLIDEAGQATPQAAVGAILRAQRVVVVGDPMQVEPVVPLPRSLVTSLCEHFQVSAAECAAPAASAQTLADAASSYSTAFEMKAGTRTVGLPLLVHRRCAEPMFRISNAVAYENLMVQATPPRASRIGEVLRESCWYHVNGTAEGHWCPQEGEVLVRMLRGWVPAEVVLPD